MRIIEYPPAEPEIEVRCPHCKALLGYTASECHWQDSAFSTQKYIKCLYCKQKIILESVPYPFILAKKDIIFLMALGQKKLTHNPAFSLYKKETFYEP